MESISNKYDVVIIGSGPGGYVAAIRAAQLGLKTAIVERDRIGGICLNWGCIPTKALLESARLLDEMRHASEFGLSCNSPSPDWAAIIKRSRGAAEKMSKGVEYLLKKNKIDVHTGFASFESATRLKVTPSLTPPVGSLEKKAPTPKGEAGKATFIDAMNIILATGARPRPLPGLEFDGKNIVGAYQAMVLPELPKRMLIVGAGAIGVEFAWFYSVMGTQVTLVELMDQVLPIEDAEVATLIERTFSKRGIDIHTGSKVTGYKKGKDGRVYTIEGKNGKEVTADVCLVATGVMGNTENLNLEAAGITLERGFFKVDDHMRTNVKGIYAIGDCAGAPLLAHAASHEGICAAETIAGQPNSGISHDNVPGCTYCHPQIASVGLTEKKAREAGLDVKIGKYLFRANGRAVAGGEIDGFVKFVVDGKYGEVLGVHIIGPGAPELIGEVVLGREFELTAGSFARTIHAHPTLSEAIMEAAGDSLGEAIHI
jgi:dihydrolipoamide dehydrogenase